MVTMEILSIYNILLDESKKASSSDKEQDQSQDEADTKMGRYAFLPILSR